MPLALFIWHKFIQPLVDRWYGKKPLPDTALKKKEDLLVNGDIIHKPEAAADVHDQTVANDHVKKD